MTDTDSVACTLEDSAFLQSSNENYETLPQCLCNSLCYKDCFSIKDVFTYLLVRRADISK